MMYRADPTEVHLELGITGVVADAAVVQLLPDAVGVELVGEVEAALVVVGGDLAAHSSEELETAGRGGPGLATPHLTDQDVPVVVVRSLRAPGHGESVPVPAGLQDHVLAGVGAAQHRGRRTCRAGRELSLHTLGPAVGRAVRPHLGAGLAQGETNKVQSQLTDLRPGSVDAEAAAGGLLNTSQLQLLCTHCPHLSRVPGVEVGVVGPGLPATAGAEGAADTEPRGTAPSHRASWGLLIIDMMGQLPIISLT